MGVTITTLVENTVTASVFPLLAEHGLSFLIQADGKPVLFDTGQGLTLLHNAASLGIDLKTVDTVVISHGHFDHTKGLKGLAGEIGHFRLIAHDRVFENKLARIGQSDYPIGMDLDHSELEKMGVQVQLSRGPVEVAPGIMTTGEIPFRNDFETVEPMFYVGGGQDPQPDDLPDDNALVVDTPQGTVVVLGCAHRGVVNTLRHVVDMTGRRKVHAVLGGMHLFLADPARLDKVCEALQEFELDRMVVGHCTGFAAMAALYQRFGNSVIPNTVGMVLTF